MSVNSANTANMTDLDKRFKEEYSDKMVRSGRITTLVAGLLTFLPALYLWFGLGYRPEWDQILAGWGIILSSYLLIYIFEPLGYYPAMGTTGLYIGYLSGNVPSVRLPAMLSAQMATNAEAGTKKGEVVGVIAMGGTTGLYIGYLSGNVPSVRLPAMLSAQMATNAEAGTKKGEVVGVIAMGVSVFTNLFFVTLAAVSGVYILEVLPPFVINAFDFCLPAILGGVLAQYWKKEKVFVPLIMVLCLVIKMLHLPSIVEFPSAIILSLVLGLVFYQRKKKKAAA